MDQLFVFLIRNDGGLYFVCALAILWFLARLVRARRILRGAMFGLEREQGSSMQSTALTFLLIFISIAAVVVYVNVEIAPTLPEGLMRPPPPTPNVFRTPLAAPTALASNFDLVRATPTAPIVPTITLPPEIEAVTTPISQNGIGAGNGGSIPVEPTQPASITVSIPECPANATIVQPVSGQIIQDSLTVIGTAGGEGFLFFDIEIRGPATAGEWRPLLPQQQIDPIDNGVLGEANLQGWDEGNYQLRLSVLGADSQDLGSCQIDFSIG
jgi:hypothetical protein